jgi:hypothetical protein
MYNSNEYYLGAEQGILLMEMAYSFLRLLNKASKHVYTGDLYRLCRQHWKDISGEPGKLKAQFGDLQHEWLFRFKEGLSIRSELNRFYRNFYVFSWNNLMSPNDYSMSEDDPVYDKIGLIPKSHVR